MEPTLSILAVGIIPAGAGKRLACSDLSILAGDHPRGCGEKFLARLAKSRWAGSSPRVRGKATINSLRQAFQRIIPAGAGKSRRRFGTPCQRRDHPRGCGEKSCAPRVSRTRPGSSPRVRGKVTSGITASFRLRIIPAGAGKRHFWRFWGKISEDHPRGCGEKTFPRIPPPDFSGSSPRVRGKGVTDSRCSAQCGIIPAGAGKRASGSSHLVAFWDHPRGCGEKRCKGPCKPAESGSSPRVRGKGGLEGEEEADAGIIPAGAGKSSSGRRRGGIASDHPRGCGEKMARSHSATRRSGSSPRVRGKAGEAGEGAVAEGIIPAGAGKRGPRARPRRAPRDHPRGCGEKQEARDLELNTPGSSPRVRGKAPSWSLLRFQGRIIPAGAGKSWSRRGLLGDGVDHPRGCGEKRSSARSRRARRGSSPRVRGKGGGGGLPRAGRGIIPAGAGKSTSPRHPRQTHRDHPRGCGEKHIPATPASDASGSSPRVRGKEKGLGAVAPDGGIIPAGAGKRGGAWSGRGGSRDHPRGCGEKFVG